VTIRCPIFQFLRGFTGTLIDCEHGVCGACTIEIDRTPARACLMLAVQADGSTLRTVQALAPQPGRLSVLQEAFRRHHALQCGFCTPGILMSLDIFLRTTSQPSEVQIRDWLSGHICHCTGYVPIVTAALDAAQQLRERMRIAKAVVYQDFSADAVVGSREAQARKRIAVSVKPQAGEIAFDQLCNRAAPDALPRADANAGSPRNVALPTSR
jgi:2-furoyl-CoA dehydrogenase 2Fe-2S iron sulfur subunit